MIGNVDTYSSQNIATHTTGDTIEATARR